MSDSYGAVPLFVMVIVYVAASPALSEVGPVFFTSRSVLRLEADDELTEGDDELTDELTLELAGLELLLEAGSEALELEAEAGHVTVKLALLVTEATPVA